LVIHGVIAHAELLALAETGAALASTMLLKQSVETAPFRAAVATTAPNLSTEPQAAGIVAPPGSKRPSALAALHHLYKVAPEIPSSLRQLLERRVARSKDLLQDRFVPFPRITPLSFSLSPTHFFEP
jgi:hypothetical protein